MEPRLAQVRASSRMCVGKEERGVYFLSGVLCSKRGKQLQVLFSCSLTAAGLVVLFLFIFTSRSPALKLPQARCPHHPSMHGVLLSIGLFIQRNEKNCGKLNDYLRGSISRCENIEKNDEPFKISRKCIMFVNNKSRVLLIDPRQEDPVTIQFKCINDQTLVILLKFQEYCRHSRPDENIGKMFRCFNAE